MVRYTNIPSQAQFRKDSSVAMAVRGNDQALHAIDRLLEQLDGGLANRFAVTGDLFLSINSWIKLFHEKSKKIAPERYPAVAALNEAVQAELASMLGVTSQGKLAQRLTEIFGASLTVVGQNTDLEWITKTFNPAEREIARLQFENGQIRRLLLDTSDHRRGLQPVNSMDFFDGISRPGAGEGLRGFAPFVMSMEREFYMNKHSIQIGGIFHSSYFGGRPVAAAGTMLVERGRLIAIRSDSGHYQPTREHMLNALRALRAKGVNLRGVLLYPYNQGGRAESARRAGQGGMTNANPNGPVIRLSPMHPGPGQYRPLAGGIPQSSPIREAYQNAVNRASAPEAYQNAVNRSSVRLSQLDEQPIDASTFEAYQN